MLETCADVPKGYVTIRAPEQCELRGTAAAVKQMLDAGLSEWQIKGRLRMREEHLRDVIFEIRKKEGIDQMARGRQTPAETVERIREMAADGVPVQDIAAETGLSIFTVNRYVKTAEAPAEPAQTPAAFALTTVMQHAAERRKVPEAVRKAVRLQLDDMKQNLEANRANIRLLQQANELLSSDLHALEEWLKEVEDDESADTGTA